MGHLFCYAYHNGCVKNARNQRVTAPAGRMRDINMEVREHERIHNIGRLYGIGRRQIYFIRNGARLQGIYGRLKKTYI